MKKKEEKELEEEIEEPLFYEQPLVCPKCYAFNKPGSESCRRCHYIFKSTDNLD